MAARASTIREPAGATAAERAARMGPWIVALLVAFTLVRGVIWAYAIPPLNAPDEPSHLIAVSQIRALRGLPVAILIDPNTLSENSSPRPPEVLAYLAQPQFHYTRFRALSYESTQPPLYHLLCAVLTRPLPADPETLLYGCRLVSVLLGALAVFAVARAAATLAPRQPAFALGVPLALTLWPQFGFQTATLNNDIASTLAGAALTWAWAAAIRRPGDRRWTAGLGALTGLGLLCKLTVAATLPGTGLILLGRARAGGAASRRFVGHAVLAGAVAAVPVLPWVGRNLQVYGEPTGAAQMLSVIHSIYTTRLGVPAETRFIVPPLGDFVWYSFSSWWGVFGWRSVFLPGPLYVVAAGVTLLGAGGAAAWLVRRVRARQPLPPAQGWPLAACAVTIAAALANYILYTVTTDASLQGRYTFVALAAVCLVGAGGVLHATRSPRLNAGLAGVALAGMVALQLGAWLTIGQS
jgi:4-amino-4-deoxy-L-arabinose transferase-like glycosyltransferase